MKKAIESAKKRLKEKHNCEFPISIIDGCSAFTRFGEIKIGREIPLELIEVAVIHEAYHIIFNIDQMEECKERDNGNPIPYFKKEMLIWNQIKKDFPDLSSKVTWAIDWEKESLGI